MLIWFFISNLGLLINLLYTPETEVFFANKPNDFRYLPASKLGLYVP